MSGLSKKRKAQLVDVSSLSKKRKAQLADEMNREHANLWRDEQARALLRWLGYVEDAPGSDQWLKPEGSQHVPIGEPMDYMFRK